MKILYINNFRGFQNTFVPLSKVNFLLGENSTGKTSFLSLLHLLSTPQFWYTQDFNANGIELGSFDEIVSSGTSSDYFEVGIMHFGEKTVPEGIYLKFTDDEGTPSWSEYRFLQEDITIGVYKTNEQVGMRSGSGENLPETEDQIGFFKNWLNTPLNKSSTPQLTEVQKDLSLHLIQKIIFEEFNELKQSKAKTRHNATVLPEYLLPTTWIAPIRAKPKRLYDNYKVNFSSEGEHIPLVLKNMLHADGNEQFVETLKNFGADSGLFENIEIKPLSNEKNAPFEIHILLNGNPLKITNVGYGVSQILPILVEVMARAGNTCFAIQQPEVHLHPKGQAALGELFYQISANTPNSFFIETHSDFIVDRFRLAKRKDTNGPNISTQVLFFERTEKGNAVHIIGIDDQGNYPDEQPEAFRSFFLKEVMDMLVF